MRNGFLIICLVVLCGSGVATAEAPTADDLNQEALDLNNQGLRYAEQNDFAKAEPMYQRSLAINEELNGPEHLNAAYPLNNLGLLYHELGDYDKAKSMYERALVIREKALGSDDPAVAKTLNNLALLSFDMGDYDEVESMYERVLAIDEKIFGPEHSLVATTLNNLGLLYSELGNYAEAKPLYERALEIDEKIYGPEHPKLPTTLSNLALLHAKLGDYAKAETLYGRALEIDQKAYPKGHPGLAITLNNLAHFHLELGDKTKAEAMYSRALEMQERLLGSKHPDTLITLVNLGALYRRVGDHDKARSLQEKVYKIRKKVLGSEHPDTLLSLEKVAYFYSRKGKRRKAKSLYERALEIREKTLGSEHPSVANTLVRLGSLHTVTGDYEKAESFHLRALAIREKIFGSDHADTARGLGRLARLKIITGEPDKALGYAIRASRGEEQTLANVLSFASEEQRLTYHATSEPYKYFASLGSGPHIALSVLRHKGVVLDSLMEDHLVAQASQDPKDRETVDELRRVKRELTQLIMETPKKINPEILKAREDKREALSKKVGELEGMLARKVAGLGRARRALSVTVADVQAVLPPETVLAEFLRYRHIKGKGKREERYGVVLIAASGEPVWVSLGEAKSLEENVQLYQKSVRAETDEATLSEVLKTLHERIVAPFERQLPPGTKSLILSPAGELNFLSFATLLTPRDRFMSEEYALEYASSGRDLLRSDARTTHDAMLIYANPDFKTTQKNIPSETHRGLLRGLAQTRDFRNMNFVSLPGTQKEGMLLKEIAEQSAWTAELYVGEDASEAELYGVRSPYILHLATHGFFLPETKRDSPLGDQKLSEIELSNPMHRSGLALAGAQATLKAWRQGEVPPIANDGIVTAEEVSGLKLDGTWLVALSACETGVGEVQSGEGVMGLRRGFLQAGSKNLLLTLWPITDEVTARIMGEFYEQARDTGNASQALAQVQRRQLVKLREEKGILAAVNLAGSFIMSSQGRLSAQE